MIITFFNSHPPGLRYTSNGFEEHIGKTVHIWKDNDVLGAGVILKVEVNKEGVEVTYETDINFGIDFRIPLELEFDLDDKL